MKGTAFLHLTLLHHLRLQFCHSRVNVIAVIDLFGNILRGKLANVLGKKMLGSLFL